MFTVDEYFMGYDEESFRGGGDFFKSFDEALAYYHKCLSEALPQLDQEPEYHIYLSGDGRTIASYSFKHPYLYEQD